MSNDPSRFFAAARDALTAWDTSPSPDTHEGMVEAYESLRWNGEVWRRAGGDIFQFYQAVVPSN